MDIQSLMDLVGSYSIFLIPIVLGITQVIKQFLPQAYLDKGVPLISLLTGIASSIAVIGINRQAVVIGVIIGLSASGLWSTAVSPFKKPPVQ